MWTDPNSLKILKKDEAKKILEGGVTPCPLVYIIDTNSSAPFLLKRQHLEAIRRAGERKAYIILEWDGGPVPKNHATVGNNDLYILRSEYDCYFPKEEKTHLPNDTAPLISQPASRDRLEQTLYWQKMRKWGIAAIEAYPEWREEKRIKKEKVKKTGNFLNWIEALGQKVISKDVTKREAEFVKAILSEVFEESL